MRAMSAPRRYVTITPGPARRIVTLLPKKSPTPMAPPIASMLSCRWVSLRLSSPVSVNLPGKSVGPDARPLADSETLLILAQVEQNFRKATHLFHGVVVNRGNSNHAASRTQPEPLHQPRRVHMAITYPNTRARHGLCDFRRRSFP